MFISSYTTIYFFVTNFFFSECLYFSEYDIRMFLLVFWLRNRPSIKYVRNQGMEGSKMCTGACRGRGVSRLMCMYAIKLSLFMFLSYVVLFYLQNFNLIFIQKGSVCQKWLLFSNDINFYCNETSSFLRLNCFSEPKLAKTLSILIKQSLMYTLYFSVIH